MQDIAETIAAALKAGVHESVSIYTGVVPDKLPTYRDGTIKPYVGVWVSLPTGFRGMEAVAGGADARGAQVNIQTQVVAATHADVMTVAGQVKMALTNLLINEMPVRPDYEQQTAAQVLTDPTPIPKARYIPLLWELKQ